VGDLEKRLGVRLLSRTTRRLSLTEDGQTFLARCTEILASVDAAEAELSTRTGAATGLLRLNVPYSFGLLQLAPLWPAFMRRHPGVTLDVVLADRVVDLVEEGFDLAVRIARLPSSSLVSRRLASTRVVLCAAPAYLAARGTPQHPSQLAAHDVLGYSLLATGDQWEFTGPEGAVSVKVQPRLRANSGDTCRMAALDGLGLILQPTFMVGADLAAGTLVEVMPDYRSIELGVYAVYPSRRFLPPKVRLMVDFLAESFAGQRWPA
jgi:DNA-binding transcriptional LysR family regulator